eukprot:TRINITY_DN1115_c0_g1_i1.p2 TRINITY_DN1115_c0_g1~~TRINITY_DN1115_c0_g1_i1.p2  ORF type:complete len:358 (+),score=94.89 TRINITY_DN1115_c0_g1_i1:63-1076(+)
MRLVMLLLLALASVAAAGGAAGLPYDVLGSVDVGTGESTMFHFRGKLYLLDNIFCGWVDHYGKWNPAFANQSYARIREFSTGAVISNITATIGTSFVSAFVDQDHGRVWLSALNVDRCKAQCGVGVLAISSTDLTNWAAAAALPTVRTCNTQVARVETPPASLPAHRYVMILEPFMFMLNNNADGDLTHGWFPAPNATGPHAATGGPSIRFENGYYYVITGGHTVYLARSRDLRNWEPPVVMVQPSPADAAVAPYVGFPEDASRKDFDPMHANWKDWDWNSNDADVCCHGVSEGGSWLIWGAGTQGAKPHPPVTVDCTNVVGFANVTLPRLLESFFE